MWNDSVILGGMVLCLVERWCYVCLNDGVMLCGMIPFPLAAFR